MPSFLRHFESQCYITAIESDLRQMSLAKYKTKTNTQKTATKTTTTKKIKLRIHIKMIYSITTFLPRKDGFYQDVCYQECILVSKAIIFFTNLIAIHFVATVSTICISYLHIYLSFNRLITQLT